MPVVRDYSEIHNPADILLRASRSQRSSTYLPRHRDWRYAAGVFRHEDEDDMSYRGRESTVWDQLDWDAQIGVFGKEKAEKRRRAVKKAEGLLETVREDEEDLEKRGLHMGLDGAVDFDAAENVAATDQLLANSEDVGEGLTTPRKVMNYTPKRILKSAAQARRIRQRFRSRADTIAGFRQNGQQAGEDFEEDEQEWVQTRLIVCLKFSCEGTDKMQRILAEELVAEQAHVATPNSPEPDLPNEVPATPRVGCATPPVPVLKLRDTSIPTPAATTTHSSDTDTDRSVRALVPFEREWFDETNNVSIKDISGILRAPDVEVPPLSEFFNWFPEAVPVDALFPPGVPISAKEIMAFYPHHIRWKSVALRLVNNAYFGDTMIGMQAFFRDKDKHPLSITNVNQFLRDVLKNDVPNFKVSNFQGKPVRNLYTDDLRSSKLLNGSRHGFVVPTFNELLAGLVYLPTGLDARGLTQCLSWYLGVRDTFTPRLDLNVLHTQSLIRALRAPLKPYGPRNLDKLALQEWKEKGQFANRRVDDEKSADANQADHSPKLLKRSRMTINTDNASVGVEIIVKLRHVLTFPYLAIGGMMCKALELGIEKAEARKATRETQTGFETSRPSQNSTQEKGVGTLSSQEEAGSQGDHQTPQTKSLFGLPAGYKIPKKKRPLPEDDDTETQVEKRMGTPLRPRAMPISERRNAIAPHSLTTSLAPPPELINRSPAVSGSAPTTAPVSMSGHPRSQTPNHYHSAPYSSTYSGYDRPPPYTSRFSNYTQPSHYDIRDAPGWNPTYNYQGRYGDRGTSAFAPRGHNSTPTTSGWNSEHNSRNWFDERGMPQPRNARYPSAQHEPTPRRSSYGGGYEHG